MNAARMIELFLDGAYYQNDQFFHPSFRKGYRSIRFSNISLSSAMSQLRRMGRLVSEDGIIRAV
jgi:hypothetical protein